MVIEQLEDYNELDGLIDPAYLPSPSMSRCFVMRDERGAIKGYQFIQTLLAIEPLWVDPDIRGTTAGYRLFKAACLHLKDNGQTNVLTHTGPENKDYLTRLGLHSTGLEAFTGEI
jgi:hypothetical protein